MIWRNKHQVIAQPPLQAQLKAPEAHDFWPGLVLVVVAGWLLVFGARHVTDIETTGSETAREHQLIKAFSNGGLQMASAPRPPDPAAYEDPAQAVAALERFAREQAGSLRAKYRVNTSAAAPCPT